MPHHELALLGYVTVLNEEIHARQIRWINRYLEKQELSEYKGMIYDVLNDVDEKIPLASALTEFHSLSEDERLDIYRLCYQLSLIDDESLNSDALDSEEKQFLQKLEGNTDHTKLLQIQKTAEKELFHMKEELFSAQNQELFQMDLSKIRQIAASDYENARTIIGELKSQCRLLDRLLSSEEEISNPQLKQALQEFREVYREQVTEKLDRLQKNISQKELACRSFSLALMGRTKAGKSTLHAIMCGEGDEFIGTGRQRTTRFNRVFSWHGLKIIDTPGIGAGESEGQKDAEIACRVISQADVICFVVADDTITKEILETLDMIAAYHKPMIVLLNHKDDIGKKSHLKKFTSDPDAWRNCTNEDRLSGWIDRLNRNAEKNGYREIMTVVPVFLLAAKKGMQEDNSTFLQASNYPGFIEQIRQSVNQNCMLYKSQTMLDEPSVQVHQALTALKEEEKTIRMFLDKVRNISNLTLVRLGALQRDAKQNALRSMRSEFDDFFTSYSAAYTDENYMVKSTFKLQESYETLLRECSVIPKIQDQTEVFLKEYRAKIDRLIRDLEEEIRYANINISLATTGEKLLFQKSRYSGVPVRGILRVVSMILDFAAIWYPALTVISVPLLNCNSNVQHFTENLQSKSITSARGFQSAA